MTPEQLAARYPPRKMEDAPRDGTWILIQEEFLERLVEARYIGENNGFPWQISPTTSYRGSDFLGWLPVPEYDYDARIGELESVLAQIATAIGYPDAAIAELPGWVTASLRSEGAERANAEQLDERNRRIAELEAELARMKGEAK